VLLRIAPDRQQVRGPGGRDVTARG
jgi:hypothetical protein